MSGERRLKLVKILTASRDVIIKKATKGLFRRRPNIASVGSNAYGEEMTATCHRDMDYYLRLVTYSIAGEPNPLEDTGIIGARQMYQSLGTPLEAMAESIQQMKATARSLMSTEEVGEVGVYFDYFITAFR